MATPTSVSGVDLLRGAAHLLRTPLGVILGTATTLRDYDARFTPERRVTYLGEVVRAAEEMKAALDGLSTLARLVEGTLPVTTQSHDLAYIVDRCHAALAGIWPEQRIAVHPAPGSAAVDDQRLAQAIEALGRAAAPVDGVAVSAGADGGPWLRIGPLQFGQDTATPATLLTAPEEQIALADAVAGPAGWPLLLARYLLTAQQARIQIEPASVAGAVILRIDLPSGGR